MSFDLGARRLSFSVPRSHVYRGTLKLSRRAPKSGSDRFLGSTYSSISAHQRQLADTSLSVLQTIYIFASFANFLNAEYAESRRIAEISERTTNSNQEPISFEVFNILFAFLCESLRLRALCVKFFWLRLRAALGFIRVQSVANIA